MLNHICHVDLMAYAELSIHFMISTKIDIARLKRNIMLKTGFSTRLIIRSYWSLALLATIPPGINCELGSLNIRSPTESALPKHLVHRSILLDLGLASRAGRTINGVRVCQL